MEKRFNISYNQAYPRAPRAPRGSRLFGLMNGYYCEPSFWARSITFCATALPIANPASMSLLKWIPAQMRERAASCAFAEKKSASRGKR
jgi:hypothetical protein